jgi:hypothetical protein
VKIAKKAILFCFIFNVKKEKNYYMQITTFLKIFIEAQSLVSIMRVVRDEFSTGDGAGRAQMLSTFFEHEINRLDAMLNECINVAKTAREKVCCFLTFLIFLFFLLK